MAPLEQLDAIARRGHQVWDPAHNSWEYLDWLTLMIYPLSPQRILEVIWPRLRKITVQKFKLDVPMTLNIPQELEQQIVALFLQNQYTQLEAVWLDFIDAELPKERPL